VDVGGRHLVVVVLQEGGLLPEDLEADAAALPQDEDRWGDGVGLPLGETIGAHRRAVGREGEARRDAGHHREEGVEGQGQDQGQEIGQSGEDRCLPVMNHCREADLDPNPQIRILHARGPDQISHQRVF